MKIFGKIIICIVVIVTAIGIAYFVHNRGEEQPNNGNLLNTNTATNMGNTENDLTENKTNTNEDYIGEEENKEEELLPEETKENLEQHKPEEEQKTEELTGKDKAVDIVKKQYAIEGQTVRFDHMKGKDYIIKINEGTAVTWYIVDGTTWEANEY